MAKNQLQLAFTKSAEKKNRAIVLKSEYKKILEDTPGWTKLEEQRLTIKSQQEKILEQVSSAYPKLVDELAALNVDMKQDRELLADLAVSELLETGKCEVMDNDGEKFYPEFSVKFKKTPKDGVVGLGHNH